MSSNLTLGSMWENTLKLSAEEHGWPCIHDERGKKQGEDLLAWAYDHFGCDAGSLLTCVVISLNWNYRAEIDSIDNDMWSRVTIRSHDVVGGPWDDGPEGERKYVGHLRDPEIVVSSQCDMIEHGLVACYKFIHDLYVLNRKPGGTGEIEY